VNLGNSRRRGDALSGCGSASTVVVEPNRVVEWFLGLEAKL
jgi:hypothetical protein